MWNGDVLIRSMSIVTRSLTRDEIEAKFEPEN